MYNMVDRIQIVTGFYMKYVLFSDQLVEYYILAQLEMVTNIKFNNRNSLLKSRS